MNNIDFLKSNNLSLFPLEEFEPRVIIDEINLDRKLISRFSNYTNKDYLEDLEKYGLENLWDLICEYVLKYGENKDFLNVSNFGEMYEAGLAFRDKILKKKSGQYYTPNDVALVMATWLDKRCDGENICDVGCGTGKLILTFFDLIGYKKAKELIEDGKIYLYDLDYTALKICKTSIILKYKIDNPEVIHDVNCDLLDKDINLPENAKVISNPPYAAIEDIKLRWRITNVIKNTKELYSSFMEKIILQSKSAVIISPYSFISGSKFYSLRRVMCDKGEGFIVSFDNVPGNIFCGRKHGIFNTNTSNSVRAAITVFNKNNTIKGFKISPLIRFKNSERQDLLNDKILEKTLSNNRQIINEKNIAFSKVDKDLCLIYDVWRNKSSNLTLKDYMSKERSDYFLCVPNTCRYFTTASSRKLNRVGAIDFYVSNNDDFNFIYCFLNSSFTYWWWRIFDGGITYPLNLLKSLPLPIKLLCDDDKLFFNETCKKMQDLEKEFVIIKLNSGKIQENIKFPYEIVSEINNRILSILGLADYNFSIFDKIHSNSFFNNTRADD